MIIIKEISTTYDDSELIKIAENEKVLGCANLYIPTSSLSDQKEINQIVFESFQLQDDYGNETLLDIAK